MCRHTGRLWRSVQCEYDCNKYSFLFWSLLRKSQSFSFYNLCLRFLISQRKLLYIKKWKQWGTHWFSPYQNVIRGCDIGACYTGSSSSDTGPYGGVFCCTGNFCNAAMHSLQQALPKSVLMLLGITWLFMCSR